MLFVTMPSEAPTSLASDLARRDVLLVSLGLCPNSELLESAPLTEEQQRILSHVKSSLDDKELAFIDEYWVHRLIRGPVSSEEGAVETFRRVAQWRREVSLADVSSEDLRIFGTRCVRSVVGGEDLYGHVVWVEQLLDVKLAAQRRSDLARGRLTEGVERQKRQAASRLGVMRYKQIHVLDLGNASGSLLSSEVRRAVEDLITFGYKFYPEGTFKIFVVNAPVVFRTGYALLSPLIAKTTRAKIRILGRHFLDAMAAEGIPRDAIPKILGGNHPGRDLLDLVIPQFFSDEGRPSSFSETHDEDDDDDDQSVVSSKRSRAHPPRPPPPPLGEATDRGRRAGFTTFLFGACAKSSDDTPRTTTTITPAVPRQASSVASIKPSCFGGS